MKLTVVAMELPFPPIHGGRVDIWRRLQALSKLGVAVQLVCWSKQDPDPKTEKQVMEVVDNLCLLKLNGTTLSSLLKKISFLPRYPLEISSRIVYGKELIRLRERVKAFNPDAVVIDHLHGCMAGRQLHRSLGIPLILRSHNIEHIYGKYLYKSAQGKRKLLRLLSLNGLERVEKATLRECAAFYDISVDDLQYWKSIGFEHGRFLPPLANFAIEGSEAQSFLSAYSASDKAQEKFDVVFLGNLNTDNNVAGIEWFLTQIAPQLHSKLDQVRILIAGSNPVERIKKLCDDLPYVTLTANPESAMEIYKSGRVLINPMAVGGGVSIKAIDMLAVGRPIVTLPKGVIGLPEKARDLFNVAHDADSFASQIIECLNQPPESLFDYALLDSLFGIEPVKDFLDDLKENVLKAA